MANPAESTAGRPNQRIGPLLRSAPEIRVTADYFGGRIDPRAFCAQHSGYTVLLADPLIIEPEPARFAVVTKFGGLVCWNCPDELRHRLWHAIAALPDTQQRSEGVEDFLDVQTGAASDAVEFDRLFLEELTLEKLKIVSLALAQSVALDHFEILVGDALMKTGPLVSKLQETGKLRSKERDVVRSVGFALQVRANVLANLTLFDDPPEIWESESLALLDAKLYDHFDLEERLSAINQKIDYLRDLNTTLLGLLDNRKSHRLEWIIIILIAIEVLYFAYAEVRQLLAGP